MKEQEFYELCEVFHDNSTAARYIADLIDRVDVLEKQLAALRNETLGMQLQNRRKSGYGPISK